MACKAMKTITITILHQEHLRKDWFFDFQSDIFQLFLNSMTKEMKKLGVKLLCVRNPDITVTVNSYADLLNAVKLSSPNDSHSNACVGHIIGKSENLDILEDIRAAIGRIAFAPETIPPADEFRKICHNCGCGC